MAGRAIGTCTSQTAATPKRRRSPPPRPSLRARLTKEAPVSRRSRMAYRATISGRMIASLVFQRDPSSGFHDGADVTMPSKGSVRPSTKIDTSERLPFGRSRRSRSLIEGSRMRSGASSAREHARAVLHQRREQVFLDVEVTFGNCLVNSWGEIGRQREAGLGVRN